MAARTGKCGKPNTGKPFGSKHVKRTPLLATGPGGELTPEHYELARRLALLGLFDLQIAEAFGVSERTLAFWKAKFPKFRETIHRAKDIADADVAASLFELAQKRMVQRKKVVATGDGVEVVSYDELIEGDFRAAAHVLACRHPEKWALNRTKLSVNFDNAEVERQEQAVADLLATCKADKAREVLAVAGFLGIAPGMTTRRSER